MHRRTRTLIPATALFACIVLLFSVGCDEKIEQQIGKMTASAVEKEYKVVDDPLLSNWVDTTGHTLLGQTVRQSIPYSFKVLDTDIVNAFAAPYGYIYVTTGLLDFAETEDEIWGVVGHEIGHVAMRHSISQVKRGFLYNIGLALLGGSSETFRDIAGVGLGLLSLRYSRENEYEADDMGRKLSFGTGYDPAGNVQFFEKLMAKYEKKRPSSIEVMFRTHPPTERRIGRQRAMPELSGDNPDALLQIGRGYASRFQVRRAENMLAKAVQLSPDDATTRLALADVQLTRGRYALAAESYQSAQRLRPGPYATAFAGLASSSQPATMAMASGNELALASALSRDAQGSSQRSGIVLSSTRQRTDSMNASIAPTVSGTHSVIDSLFGLADLQPDLPDLQQNVIAYANGTVNHAIEPVYSVEKQREDLLATAEQIQTTMTKLTAKLALARKGAVPAQDVTVMQRTLDEAARALDDVNAALGELERARPAVEAAQQAASETTAYVDRIMRGDASLATAQLAEQSSHITGARGLAALAATRKAKKLTDRASVRALVARVNTAAVGASGELRDTLDGLVGHYLAQPPVAVRQLRAKGLGYGDAALVLGAAPSVKAEPSELASLGAGVRSVVDTLTASGARTDGAQVLMKYLANAMEYETGEDQK